MSQATTSKEAANMAFAWQFCLALALSAVIIVAPDMAFANAGATPFANTFCTVTKWFTGSTGKALATIAITIIGIGALLGKVSWGMALIVGTGVAIIFGAAGIVNAIEPNSQGATCA